MFHACIIVVLSKALSLSKWEKTWNFVQKGIE